MDEKKDIPAEEKASPPQETVPNLKDLREARGLSLQDIFETTRVGLINLAAVENGDFNRLPPPVYARNFIRKYARAVGIDEKPILDRYEKYLESLKPPSEETEVQKPWPETGRRYRFLFASLAAVIIAGILVSALFLYDQAGKPPSPAVRPSESPSPAPVIPVPAPDSGRSRIPSAQATTAGSATGSGSGGEGHPAAGRCGKDVPSRHRGPRTHLDPDHGRPESLLPGSPQAGRQDRADGLRLFPARYRQCGGNQSHLPGESLWEAWGSRDRSSTCVCRKRDRTKRRPEEVPV